MRNNPLPLQPGRQHNDFLPDGTNIPSKVSTPLIAKESGKIIPIILVGFYFVSLWQLPIFPIALRWFMVLGLAIMAFIIQKSKLNTNAAVLFWVVYGLSFLGAVLSLLRAPNLDLALWNTAGIGISFVTYLLFLPILATRFARRILLIALVGVAFFWAFEIQWLLRMQKVLFYSTFSETGADKNLAGFCLSLASIALFYLCVFWKPLKAMPKIALLSIRVFFGLGGIYFLYSIVLIYARSAILTEVIGICVVLVILLIKSPSGSSKFFSFVFIVFVIALSVKFLLPSALAASPVWEMIYDKYALQGINALDYRTILFQKGLFLISENPFLGVGVGGARATVSSATQNFPGYFIHNSYLTDWAEKGIFGLLSDVVWIIMYFKVLRRNFISLPIFDQIWLLLFFLLFFELNFIDIGSVSMTMLTILAGIYYEQYQIRKA